MRRALLRFAFASFVVAAATTGANAETINCPVTNAMRTITTPIPGDWWTTPVVAALSQTRVADVGGRITLQCEYGNAGTIARYAPDRQACVATPGGFNCSPTLGVGAGLIPLAPLPVTYSTGAIEWAPSYRIDLDSGVIGAPGVDLWYQAVDAVNAYITPMNGAAIGPATVGSGGYAGCLGAPMSPSSVPTASIRLGSYVCVKTSEGRISEFRLNNISGSAPPTWLIGYTTWQ